MPAVPRSLLTFGASLLSARAAMRLKRTKSANADQERVFLGLIPKLAAARTWKEAGVERGMAYDDFREKVRPGLYDDFSQEIERMKRGEADVLWPGTCHLYSNSAGTAGGPKSIPVTEAMLGHFRRAGLHSLLWYSVRAGNRGVFRGRHLYLGGSTALAPIADSEPFEAYSGDPSAIAHLGLPGWVERSYFEPGAEIAQMDDWKAKIAAIAARTRGTDISLVSGFPGWALLLADALLAKGSGDGRADNLQQVWPNLECFRHSGVPAGPFQDELHAAMGPTVNFHEVYEAPEAFIAAQDAESAAGLRLMADCGVFFEFIPLSDFDEGRARSLGPKAVPLSGVQTGMDYALLLTTPGGLVRYVIGDIVRFTSLSPARITYSGRTGLMLNAFGERVTEREATEALVGLCRRNGWNIVNFHVAPFYSSSTVSQARGRHEWWVELKAGTLITPTGPIMAPELDAELRRTNRDYASKRNGGTLDAPFVRLVMPGVFEHWMRYHGRWGGRNKMPRCSSDRSVADGLSKVLQFAKD